MKKNYIKISVGIILLILLLLGQFDTCGVRKGMTSKEYQEIVPYSSTNEYGYGNRYSMAPYSLFPNFMGSTVVVKEENREVTEVVCFGRKVPSHLAFLLIGTKPIHLYDLVQKVGPPNFYATYSVNWIHYEVLGIRYWFSYTLSGSVELQQISDAKGNFIDIQQFQTCVGIAYGVVISAGMIVILCILKKRKNIGKKQSTEPPAPTE